MLTILNGVQNRSQWKIPSSMVISAALACSNNSHANEKPLNEQSKFAGLSLGRIVL
jgi:hypothetical protein